MAFHTKTEPGKSMSREEAATLIAANFINKGQAANQVGQSKLYWGFVPKEILELLLQESGCVGIRIYNAFNKNTNEKLVLVGVTEDGAEIQQLADGQSGYFISNMKFHDEQETKVEMTCKNIDRLSAAQGVWVSWASITHEQGGPDISFASYFSAQAIRSLLQPEASNGINFYVVGLQSASQFPFTHLATSAQHLEDSNRIERLEVAILCPNPCPNHCAPERPTTDATDVQDTTLPTAFGAAPFSNVQINQSSFSKYLINWR